MRTDVHGGPSSAKHGMCSDEVRMPRAHDAQERRICVKSFLFDEIFRLAFKIPQGFHIIQGDAFTFHGDEITATEIFKDTGKGFGLNR
jgi:hypothetical protein